MSPRSPASASGGEPSAVAHAPLAPPLDRFAIGFDERDRSRLHALWDEVIDRQRWAEGPMVEAFEAAWSASNGVGAVAFGGWAGAALAALDFAGVAGGTVLCPSNTFIATPLAIQHAGAHVEFVDCNRDDLCLSFTDLAEKVERHRPRAVFLVHIGGHIAFEVERIAALCRDRGIFLIEDCAHAHGAAWHGRTPGTWGDAGVWSFYATKRSRPARAACSSRAIRTCSTTRARSATTASPTTPSPA